MAELGAAMDGVIKKSKQAEWLTTPNDALDGKTPSSVMAEGHAEKVLSLLHDIEFGMPS